MGKRYLIDTNVIIDFGNNRIPSKQAQLLASIIDGEPYISFITKIELLGFSNPSEAVIEFAENAIAIFCDEEILKQCVEIRKEKRIKLPDALIAATALVHDFIILTRNTSDFSGIQGLEIQNPYHLS
ncbi:MAG: type II toxin-antitoxin system VapC family toxin [Bacteroidia bacterium]